MTLEMEAYERFAGEYGDSLYVEPLRRLRHKYSMAVDDFEQGNDLTEDSRRSRDRTFCEMVILDTSAKMVINDAPERLCLSPLSTNEDNSIYDGEVLSEIDRLLWSFRDWYYGFIIGHRIVSRVSIPLDEEPFETRSVLSFGGRSLSLGYEEKVDEYDNRIVDSDLEFIDGFTLSREEVRDCLSEASFMVGDFPYEVQYDAMYDLICERYQYERILDGLKALDSVGSDGNIVPTV